MRQTTVRRDRDYVIKFDDNQWYNTTQAVARLELSRTTFWRRVRDGAVRWKLRQNYPGKWFKGRDLNNFYNATYGI
ncbi:MAG: hypothetical protein NC117_02870 [Pseudoflavonifractor sp.]|nr:hypothetical protein [Pseudoflavonifractor sp.]